MTSKSPDGHAEVKKGLVKSPKKFSDLLNFQCGCCGRSWTSRTVKTTKGGEKNSMTQRCFGCDEWVSPKGVKSESSLPHGTNRGSGMASGGSARSKQSFSNHFSQSLNNRKESERQILVNTCGVQNGSRMFGKEAITEMPVLFDSGAEVSIIAARCCGGKANLGPPDTHNLKGVTGQSIASLGVCTIPLDLGFSRVLTHDLVVVDLDLPYIILGLDFMTKQGIVLDPKAEAAYLSESDDAIELFLFQEIFSRKTEEISEVQVSQMIKSLSINRIEVSRTNKSDEAYQGEKACLQILNSYSDLIRTPDYNQPVKHSFALDIKLMDVSSILQKPRRFTPLEHEVIKEHMNDLCKRGAAIRGASEYVAPIVLVPKKNKKLRVCVDYSRLNAQTMSLNYPIPLIRDLAFHLRPEHQWYSVLDLQEAYYSLPLTQRASERAAIITRDGVFKPLRTQFGLKNAPAAFCEMVATMVRGLEEFVFFYLDDFIVYSKTITDHVHHVRLLLDRLNKYGMSIQPEKCHFCEEEVNFLGYQISKEGFLPLENNVKALREITPPTNLQELRRFLGMVNYYHNFVPELARILAPLHQLLQGHKRPKKRKIEWLGTHQQAFEQAKEALANVTHLAFDNPLKKLILTTDGSGTHCGAVLETPVGKELSPLAFFSKPFAATTRTRSAFNRELTALYLSVKHFKNVIRGRDLLVRTDHKALVNAVQNGHGEHSVHEQRMLNYITEYGPSMEHIAGQDNPVADTLSRPNVVNDLTVTQWQLPPVTEFARYQDEDPDMLETVDDIKNSTDMELLVKQVDGLPLYGVVDKEQEGSKFRPIVPKILQSAVFHVFHDCLHQGVEKSIDVILRHYFWKSLKKDIETWVKYCPKCQTCKVSRHNRQVLENFPGNPERLGTIHMDIVGPLTPSSEDHHYLLTMRDRNTGFSRIMPMMDKSTSSVVQAFKLGWISIFGVPNKVVTDNGGEFISEDF